MDRLSSWLPVVGLAGLIVILSSIPAADLPPQRFDFQDKLIHGFEYAVLAALLARALLRGPPRLSTGLAVGVAVVAAALFGVTDELHQIATPGRHASIADVVADSCGALGGAALAGLFYPPWLRRSQSRSSGQD